MHPRRRAFHRLHLRRRTGLLVLVLLIGPFSLAVASAQDGARWDGRTFTSFPQFSSHLSKRGVKMNDVLARHPQLAASLGLRGVRWDGKVFYTVDALRSRLAKSGISFERWSTRHPASMKILRANANADLRRLAGRCDRERQRSTEKCGTAPASQSAPSISGTPTPGQVVSVSTGTWSGTNPIAYAYGWQRCDAAGANCGEIAGATGSSYTVRDVDSGSRLRGVVTASNAAGSSTALSAASATVASAGGGGGGTAAVAPAVVSAPVVTGSAQVGATVTTSAGAWSGTAPIAYAYRWQRCSDGGGCSSVTGATAASYTVQQADVGLRLQAVVTATNAAGSSSAPSALTTSVTAASSSPPPPPTSTSGRFGIAAGGLIEWATDANLARELDGYVAIGAKWLRSDLKWAAVEQTRGTFNWSIYDRLLAAAKARGLSVVWTLAYTPAWARPAGTDDKHAPTNVADFVPFARAAVARYAPQGVKHYEIWNEPNITSFWKPAPDPVKYTALLKQAYAAMKQVDPSITVLAGATSPAGGYNDPACNGNPSSTPNVNAINFLETIYRNGGGGSFDAFSMHPYTHVAPSRARGRCNAWAQMSRTSPSLRSTMAANGDSAKQIWATEFGTHLAWVARRESTQAAYLTDAFTTWLSYPWAGQLMYYSYKQPLGGYDLVRTDWSPRAAWRAYRTAPKS